eukprot:3594888-Pyramimonas_sp.AAC.1
MPAASRNAPVVAGGRRALARRHPDIGARELRAPLQALRKREGHNDAWKIIRRWPKLRLGMCLGPRAPLHVR